MRCLGIAILALITLTFVALFTCYIYIIRDGVYNLTTTSEKDKQHQQKQQLDRFEALRIHQKGAWKHYYVEAINKSIGEQSTYDRLSQLYTPLEIDWLTGKNNLSTSACLAYKDVNASMYSTQLGNQCGCGMRSFQPSHSVWVYDNHNHTLLDENMNGVSSNSLIVDDSNEFKSPSLKLIERLAEEDQNLCFFGDSIDFQFYDALRSNLQRVIILQQMNISIQSQDIQVNYTNETGPSWFGSKHFRYLDYIKRTTVFIDNSGLNTSFSFIKSYGWIPGHTSFLDDCSIIIANLALHYNAGTMRRENAAGKLLGSTLATDFRAAITFLASSNNAGGIAIWRSALPQHFSSSDGHYYHGRKSMTRGCSIQPRKPNGTDATIQHYNELYNEQFALFCNNSNNAYEVECTVNRQSLEYPTVYKYYREEKCCDNRLERLERGNANVTGTILRWEISDLFDTPIWHVDDMDCSHFCYVPSLYESAFERLILLLQS